MTGKPVRIGKIVGCHGIRGDVKVRATSADAPWAGKLKSLSIQKPKQDERTELRILECRQQGPLLLLRLEGYDSRTAAEPLIGSVLYADSDNLPAPKPGEYWVDDLIGLTVRDLQTGRTRGRVKDVLSAAGSDFLEIQLEDSSETAVVPFIDRFFPQVDMAQQVIEMDLISDFLASHSEPVTPDRLKQ